MAFILRNSGACWQGVMSPQFLELAFKICPNLVRTEQADDKFKILRKLDCENSNLFLTFLEIAYDKKFLVMPLLKEKLIIRYSIYITKYTYY